MEQPQTPTFTAPSDLTAIRDAMSGALPLRKIKNFLEHTGFSADSKSLILDISHYVIIVGGHVISLGRKIVSLALQLIKTFPNITFGVAMAMILSSLAGGILAGLPFVGVAIAGFLKGVLLFFGLSMGAVADMISGTVGSGLASIIDDFTPLSQLKA